MNFFESLPAFSQQLIIDWTPGILKLLGKLVYAVVILLVGRWASYRVQDVCLAVMRKAKIDEALSLFLASLVRYAVLAAAIIAALEKLDIRTASLLAVFASAGLAVGLALQGSLSNFAAGTMILFFRPFTKGDQIEAAGKVGAVDEIGIFTTRLTTASNESVIIPNSMITGGCITNFTARGYRRCQVMVGVSYGEDIARVVSVLQQAAEKNSLGLSEPPAGVFFDDLGASSLNFKVSLHASNENFWPALHELRSQIFNDLNEAKIEMPFQQVVVHQPVARSSAG